MFLYEGGGMAFNSGVQVRGTSMYKFVQAASGPWIVVITSYNLAGHTH